MKINIRTREIDLTDAIRAYAEKKMLALVKFFPNITLVEVELSKLSKHHKKGDVFSAKITLTVPNKVYRVEEVEPVLYKAIDKAKDDLKRSLTRMRSKSRDMSRQGREVIIDRLASDFVNEI